MLLSFSAQDVVVSRILSHVWSHVALGSEGSHLAQMSLSAGCGIQILFSVRSAANWQIGLSLMATLSFSSVFLNMRESD